jgi:ubiquinone/menaquinone biosynthesis C-methylase UbiE
VTEKARENLHVHYAADAYDRYTAEFVRPYDNVLVDRLTAELRGLSECSAALDVGTGTGQLLVRIARLPQFERTRFTGTDYFDDMLAVARRNVAQAGLSDRVALLCCDVHAMPFGEDAFDLIVSRSTVHHWADPPVALAEIYRVLARGGVALIHDVRRDAPAEAVAAFNASRAAAGIEPSRLEEKYTLAEMRQFLRDAGLRGRALVMTSPRGPASIGLEVRLTKPKVWRCL